MNLVSVYKAADLVGKTPNMIYYLANQNVFTKHPAANRSYGDPVYLLDANEVVSYYQNKEPRTDYSTFLNTASVVIDGEEYVSLQLASTILNQTHSRIRYITQRYEVRSTTVTKPRKGSVPHMLFCLRELSDINETVAKILELRGFLDKAKKKQ